MNYKLITLAISVFLGILSCTNDDNANTIDSSIVNPGNDPNFTIVAHSDTGFTATNRKVVVFDIPIYAYAEVEDSKLLHAANLMAQYLDNDEDGIVDNQVLLNALISNEAALFMWKTES